MNNRYPFGSVMILDMNNLDDRGKLSYIILGLIFTNDDKTSTIKEQGILCAAFSLYLWLVSCDSTTTLVPKLQI